MSKAAALAMTRHRTLASTLVCLMLAGCGGAGYPWYREGMTSDQLKADEEDCASQARDYSFLQPGLAAPNTMTPGGGPSGRVVVQDEGDRFRTCMNAKGYARVQPPKKEDAAKSGTGK
jgi:hypothetical protein